MDETEDCPPQTLNTLSQNSLELFLLLEETSAQLPGDCAKALPKADALQDDACLQDLSLPLFIASRLIIRSLIMSQAEKCEERDYSPKAPQNLANMYPQKRGEFAWVFNVLDLGG